MIILSVLVGPFTGKSLLHLRMALNKEMGPSRRDLMHGLGDAAVFL